MQYYAHDSCWKYIAYEVEIITHFRQCVDKCQLTHERLCLCQVRDGMRQLSQPNPTQPTAVRSPSVLPCVAAVVSRPAWRMFVLYDCAVWLQFNKRRLLLFIIINSGLAWKRYGKCTTKSMFRSHSVIVYYISICEILVSQCPVATKHFYSLITHLLRQFLTRKIGPSPTQPMGSPKPCASLPRVHQSCGL